MKPMIVRSSLLAAVLGAGLLAGCTIFPEPDPVQTYRFGAMPSLQTAAPSASAQLEIALRPVEFVQASRGDRILGVVGNETAYIGGARWVSRANELYEDGLRQALAGRSDRLRLLGRREPSLTASVLQVDVTTFEARYAARDQAPVVVVSAHAVLTRHRDAGQAGRGEQTFSVSVPAQANRVSAIVDAFDTATQQVNQQIADWTAAGGY